MLHWIFIVITVKTLTDINKIKPKKRNLKQKLLMQWFFLFISIHIVTHQVFLKIHLKQSVRKLSDINFNYTERLHFALVSEFSLTKIWESRSTSSKNPDLRKTLPHKFPIYWICSTSSIISNKAVNTQTLVIYFPFT